MWRLGSAICSLLSLVFLSSLGCRAEESAIAISEYRALPIERSNGQLGDNLFSEKYGGAVVKLGSDFDLDILIQVKFEVKPHVNGTNAKQNVVTIKAVDELNHRIIAERVSSAFMSPGIGNHPVANLLLTDVGCSPINIYVSIGTLQMRKLLKFSCIE